jgi:hypothetical protein
LKKIGAKLAKNSGVIDKKLKAKSKKPKAFKKWV